MSQEPSSIEQAVARALRENLEPIQRTSDELQQALNDVVAACSSTKPSNAIPPMLRAQTAAASLSAALEVLARFVTLTETGPRSPLEEKITQAIGANAPTAPAAAPHVPEPKAAAPAASRVAEHKPAPAAPAPPPPVPVEPPAQHFTPTPAAQNPVELDTAEVPVAANGEFDVSQLPAEEQELHRRANRVAKVSMQDIKMLRPEQVRLGREHKDICIRLKDDIEKAHREYDRRFKPIMEHPVDYFYRWLVEILADGDASCLGEYPYAPASKAR
jgi:hypothetical protein